MRLNDIAVLQPLLSAFLPVSCRPITPYVRLLWFKNDRELVARTAAIATSCAQAWRDNARCCCALGLFRSSGNSAAVRANVAHAGAPASACFEYSITAAVNVHGRRSSGTLARQHGCDYTISWLCLGPSSPCILQHAKDDSDIILSYLHFLHERSNYFSSAMPVGVHEVRSDGCRKLAKSFRCESRVLHLSMSPE